MLNFLIIKLLKSIAMNTTEIKGNWNELKGKLKKKYAILTDNDLMFEDGREDELYGRLQKRLGKTKSELRKIFDEL
jgi:uncharacterized protein YjbJ (UPF0337 family)